MNEIGQWHTLTAHSTKLNANHIINILNFTYCIHIAENETELIIILLYAAIFGPMCVFANIFSNHIAFSYYSACCLSCGAFEIVICVSFVCQ